MLVQLSAMSREELDNGFIGETGAVERQRRRVVYGPNATAAGITRVRRLPARFRQLVESHGIDADDPSGEYETWNDSEAIPIWRCAWLCEAMRGQSLYRGDRI